MQVLLCIAERKAPSMTVFESLAPDALALLFVLGLRHGLDPDHIAVIDNITFRAMDDRPAVAPWTGFLFSAGHSVSVMVIATLFGLAGQMFHWPDWFARGMSWLVIALLVLVGTLNLRALLSRTPYRAQGWRHALVPGVLKTTTHPLATLLIGALFGLVVDTAAQVATWGATAAAAGGLPAAAIVGACFALGMVATDTADSLIVARLLRGARSADQVALYRRRIGWLIVALSYGMAIVSLVNQLRAGPAFSDDEALLIGGGAAAGLIAIIAAANLRRLRHR